MLEAFGFDSAWVSRVMSLVTSVSYSYQVNDFLSRKLIPNRGLRQGDPLSPYLFIMVFDVLSRLISKAHSNEAFKGIKLAPTAPYLTHLFFADDAIIFSDDNSALIYQLTSILNCFTKASGQMINTTKSGMICGAKVSEALKRNLFTITTFPTLNNPGKYLGIPADWGRAKSQGLSWVKEKVLARMEGLKGSPLNQAGKEVLLKQWFELFRVM